jgi:hypothetical protein
MPIPAQKDTRLVTNSSEDSLREALMGREKEDRTLMSRQKEERRPNRQEEVRELTFKKI